MIRYLNELRPGQKAKIIKIDDNSQLKKKLMEMGFREDKEIFMRRRAPLGDPMELSLMGNNISLRKSEARFIRIEGIENICSGGFGSGRGRGQGRGLGRKGVWKVEDEKWEK